MDTVARAPRYYCVIIRRRENPIDARRGPTLHTHGTPPSYQTWLLSRRLPPATSPGVRPARHPRSPRSHLAMFFAPPCASIRRQRCVGPLTATPSRFSDAGAKIFKTKCAQCHVAESGGGHKQVRARTSPRRPRSPIRRGDPSPRVRPASLPVSLSRRGGDDVGGAVPSGFTPRETSTPRPDDDSNRRRALTPRLPLPPRSTRRAPTSAASSVASPAPPRASRTPRPTRTRA